MKCFIGLPAAPSVINKLVDAQDRALSFDAGARPVPKENFHLTLAFIGEIEPDKARLIAQLLPLTTDFNGKSWLIDNSGLFIRPQVAWVGGCASPEIEHLARESREILDRLHISYDKAVLNRISPFFGNRIWLNLSFSILLNGRFCVREYLNLD